MDSMPFGPSCCALQTTFQTRTMEDMQKLSDQLIPICPIIMALTAATPIHKGYLADLDCRWNVIKAALDDRTDEERGLKPLLNDRYNITTSRYDSVEQYYNPEFDKYSDIGITFCSEAFEQMINSGIPKNTAEGVAHLFLRDPIQLFKEKLDENDDQYCNELFECIHLFHWHTVRSKFPPADKSSGWKLEFRPCEIQPTDFQNAAFCVFTFLLTRLILEDKIHLITPISDVFHNMSVAQFRDAATEQKFTFRKNILTSHTDALNGCSPIKKERAKLTAHEIINGCAEKGVTGIAPIMIEWLAECQEITDQERQKILKYVNFVQDRASGKVKTTARWIREFVRSHSNYAFDSVVRDEIAYDLLFTLHKAATGVETLPDLQGDYE